MEAFENLTYSPDIIINEKIINYEIIKSGNTITVNFITNPNSAIFTYDEPLVTFPFNLKHNVRIQSFHRTFSDSLIFLASGQKGKNTITFTAPGGYEFKNSICSFSFFI